MVIPFLTAIINVEDGVIKSIDWDDGQSTLRFDWAGCFVVRMSVVGLFMS